MAYSESSWSSILERHNISPTNDNIQFLVGRNIVLNLDEELHQRERDSSRASSKQLCEYKWADKSNYKGRIMSVRGKMVAYRLYNQNSGEAVRVLDRETRSRHLIKDFRSKIVDLQWAIHTNLLAVVDSDACLHIYKVDENGEKCEKYLNIMRDKHSKPLECKISWCPTQNCNCDDDEFALLALYYGKRVELIDLSILKKSLRPGNVEVDVKHLTSIPEAFRSVTLDNPINTVKISPDASALVVCTTNGKLIFYIASEKDLRVAQDFEPIQNHAAENIIFLDDLTIENPTSFWRYAVISTDNGRKLWLFDCDDFTLVGKARIDAPNVTNPLEVTLDLTSKYLFVIDYDAKNIFAFEIAFVSSIPHFVAVTMVAFYNPLIISIPVKIEESLDETGLSLDDDDETNTNMTALFVSISPKALLEIRIDLEKTLNFEPATTYKAIPDNVSENPENFDGNTSNLSGSAKSTHSHSGAKQSNIATELNKMNLLIGDKFDTVNIKFNELKDELETVKLELQNVKSDTRSDLVTALEGISNELKNRDEKINETITNGINKIRDEIIKKIDDTSIQTKQKMDLNRDKCLEVIGNTISHIVVPSLEILCKEMFKQLNEQMNIGLNEFNDQLKRVQTELVAVASSTAPTPQIPDIIGTIVQLIEAEKYKEAFEVALTHSDLSGLMTICTRIDIDDFFEGSPLPVPKLLQILELISTKINHETSLKLHIAELVLMIIDVGDDPIIKTTARAVVSDFIASVNDIQKPDSPTKRQIRVVMQLATSLLKNTADK